MNLDIGKEVAAMKRMTVNELRAKYAEVFGEETGGRHKQWLMRRIAWRMQAVAEGGLSERARRRAAELANDADLRTTAPRAPKPAPAPAEGTATGAISVAVDNRLPPPGQEIMREYKGQKLIVRVLQHGFEFEGEVYKSLSAVAKAITGTHCNGYLFFRLGGQGGEK
ncbi:MAG: DUF2924 domain-containing protein [Planctomycetia bacterium]|nr:DUF2924 domain-containing protein [Planctomycetia bacterium]